MGYFKVDRSLFNHYLWTEKPFSKGQAWIDLIGLANYEDTKTAYQGKTIICKRGTVCRSISFLAKRWGWGRGKTRNYLKLLESDNMIRINTTTHRTTITIENYGKFQDVPSTNRATNRQQTVQQTDSKPCNEKRNIKKDKESKEYIYRADARFVPPTVEEVFEYCQERQNGVDANEFIDFYSARGWKLSKGLAMSDWKAAVRGWERRTQTKSDSFDNHPDQRKGYHDLSKEIFGI